MEIGAITLESTGTEKWPKLPLSPADAKAWMLTRTLLLQNQPAFADVWFRMMQDKDRELAWFTDQCPVAATDDRYMFINPVTFFKYTLQQRVFIACHEIMHAICNHVGMSYRIQLAGYILYPDGLKLPYNHDMMQMSTDCLVNDTLVRGRVGEMPPDATHGLAGITYMDDITTAYRKYYQASKKGNKGGTNAGSSQRSNSKSNDEAGKGFDVHLRPGQGSGKSTAQAQDERNPQAWDNALAAALASAKAQGKLSATLERGLSRLLDPVINWKDELPVLVSRRLGTDFSTWDTLDNELMLRGIGSPGKAKYGCGTVVFACDSSGSINQKTMDMFCTEGVSLMEQARPRELVFIQCDAAVHECVTLDSPEDMMRPIKGGGGTDFRPVFERIAFEGLDPDILIYLTDLEGTFPLVPPGYPVIWATIKDHPVPFGDRILIPCQLSE